MIQLIGAPGLKPNAIMLKAYINLVSSQTIKTHSKIQEKNETQIYTREKKLWQKSKILEIKTRKEIKKHLGLTTNSWDLLIAITNNKLNVTQITHHSIGATMFQAIFCT